MTGEPETADIQAELYFKALSGWDAATWLKVCEEYAQGSKWPSISELKESLSYYSPKSKALPAPTTIFITKDEFGTDLYKAIETQGARLQCLKFAKSGIGNTKDWEQRAQGYEKELQVLLDKITDPNDVRRILQMS